MTDTGCFHAVAICQDCGWKEEDYLKNVSELAQNHAKENKHKVSLELGFLLNGTIPSKRLKSFGMDEEGY